MKCFPDILAAAEKAKSGSEFFVATNGNIERYLRLLLQISGNLGELGEGGLQVKAFHRMIGT